MCLNDRNNLKGRWAGAMRVSVAGMIALVLLACIGTTAAAAELSLRSDEYVIFHHHDALGSTVATTGADGEVLWFEDNEPYGRSHGRRDRSNAQLDDDVTGQFEEDGYSRPGYTGHVRDGASGLVYMQARFYDPELGRFLSIDPVGFTPSNTTSFNRYAYANNNPYKYVDPDGEFAVLAWFATPPGIAALAAAGEYTAGAIAGAAIGVGLYGAIDNIVNNESTEPAEGRTLDDPLPPDPRKPTQANPNAPDPDAEGAHTTVGTRGKPRRSPEPYTQGITYDEDGNPIGRTDVTDHGRGDHENPHWHPWDPEREVRYDPENPGDFGPAETIPE